MKHAHIPIKKKKPKHAKASLTLSQPGAQALFSDDASVAVATKGFSFKRYFSAAFGLLLILSLFSGTSLRAAVAVEEQKDSDTEESVTKSTVAVTENDIQKEEVVYASLDSSGSTEQVYVVNVLNPSTPGEVTDYGDYESVQSLTESSDLSYSKGAVSVEVEGDSLSYQGNLVSKNLPWNIAISYLLDGKTVSASSLAGASGELEIQVATSKNVSVDSNYYENYLLQITITLPGDKSRNIVTEEGALALAGSDTQVTFTGMPDKEGSFTVKATIENFEMQGIGIAAVPFSMAIESPDTSEFTNSLEDLNKGVGELDAGTSELTSGIQSFSSGVSQLGTGLNGISDGMKEAANGAELLSSSSNSIKAGLDEAALGAAGIQGGSNSFNSGLQGVSQSAQGVQAMMADPRFQALLADPDFAQTYSPALSTLAFGVPQLASEYTALNNGIQAMGDGILYTADAYGQFNEGVASQAAGMSYLSSAMCQLASSAPELVSGAAELAQGSAQLSSGTHSLYTETQGMPEKVQEEIDKLLSDYDKSDYVPQSFTSTKNTNVKLVQFVFATESIEIPEPESEPEVEEEKGILERALALFGL